MSNIVIFGPTHSGKTTLLGYLTTAKLHSPQFNDDVLQRLKLIRTLSKEDDFNIGNPYNPVNVNKDIILPSFVSLDRDELRKFRGEGEKSEGTSKRIHRQQLTICLSPPMATENHESENTNVNCTFIDMPGFRQRLSDKYRGFFEGDIGISVLEISEIIRLWNLKNKCPLEERETYQKAYLERRLFEPLRIWCDYRSPSRLVIAISKIDKNTIGEDNQCKAGQKQFKVIEDAIACVESYTRRFNRGQNIPVVPISIRLTSEEAKPKSKMRVFFHRIGQNIYSKTESADSIGCETLISYLNHLLSEHTELKSRDFSMANVDRLMRTYVNNSARPVLSVHTLHGSLHRTDKVFLGPVNYRNRAESCYLECTISSLKADGATVPTESLLEGNVGGVILKTCRLIEGSEEIPVDLRNIKSNLKILKSTILYSGSIVKGDIIRLEILKDEHICTNDTISEIYSEILPSLMPFDQVFLLWYGKRVSVNVIEIMPGEKSFQLSVIITKGERSSFGHFVLPCSSDGELLHRSDNVLIAIPAVYYSMKPPREIDGVYTYVSANITKIMESAAFVSVKMEAEESIPLEMMLDNVGHRRDYESLETNSFIIPIKSKLKQIDIYSVLSNVKHGIRRWINHVGYKNLGGVRMTLLENGEEKSPTALNIE